MQNHDLYLAIEADLKSKDLSLFKFLMIMPINYSMHNLMPQLHSVIESNWKHYDEIESKFQ